MSSVITQQTPINVCDKWVQLQFQALPRFGAVLSPSELEQSFETANPALSLFLDEMKKTGLILSYAEEQIQDGWILYEDNASVEAVFENQQTTIVFQIVMAKNSGSLSLQDLINTLQASSVVMKYPLLTVEIKEVCKFTRTLKINGDTAGLSALREARPDL